MAYDRGGRKVQAPADLPAEARTPNRRAAPDSETARTGPIRGARGTDAAEPKSNAKAEATKAAAGTGAFSRLRVLPVVMFVAVLLLSFKVTSLWEAIKNPQAFVSVATLAEAEQQPAPVPAAARATQIAQASKADSEDETPLDPVLFTRSEIELLQELSKRRKELDARERTIIQREGLLTAAETRIEKKINELQDVKADIETLIKKYDEQEEAQFSGLVSIYEKMKPKDAARIFDELGIDILLEVFDRMKASKSAPILAKMRPDRAKEITARIAERREMPKIN